ncbi:hypothetical protein Bca4012_019358 [Brassica carinata]
MKPESKKKRIPIKQEDDDISFNLSSLKEVVEDCTEKKKTSSSNTKNQLDLSSLSKALSLVKRKINRKERRRKRDVYVKRASEADPAAAEEALIQQLFDLAKVGPEDLNSHSNKPTTQASTEPQLCTLNKEMDILDLYK